MTDAAVDALVDRINAAGSIRGAVYVSGGGTGIFPILLGRGGGSRTLLAGRIPYDAADFRSILGFDPGPLAGARAARALATCAHRHALAIRGEVGAGSVFGVGATSKLATGPGERAGREHAIHAVLQTSSRTLCRAIRLPEGLDRPAEERINALALLDLVARAKGIDPGLPADDLGLPAGAIVDEGADAAGLGLPGLPGLLEGRSGWVVDPDGSPPPRLLLPGSFRPLHDGHLRMAEVAAEVAGEPCGFELSAFHPEKPPLDYLALGARLAGLRRAGARVVLTAAPTYLDKARLFPGCTFAVGRDTAERIVDPRFYGGEAARDAMLDELAALGARLLIFGRVDGAGRFRDDWAGPAPSAAVAAFRDGSTTTVSEASFRLDVSSTAIRDSTAIDPP